MVSFSAFLDSFLLSTCVKLFVRCLILQYCIVFKSRCNSTVKRDVIVPEVARIIEDLNEDWRVNYHSPDYVVSLDVITVNVILPHPTT